MSADRTGQGPEEPDRRPLPHLAPMSRADEPRRGPAVRTAPVTFVQRSGDSYVEWSVVEVDAAGVPGARGARCLVFTRRDCIRRVWDYPDDWRALDDAGLAALSWNR